MYTHKNLLVGLMLLLFVANFAYAQNVGLGIRTLPDHLKKGNQFISMDGGGGLANSFIKNSRNFSIVPAIGYMPVNRLVVGLRVSYGQDYTKLKESTTPSNTVFNYRYHALAPELFARYYFLPYRIKPFLQVSTGYNFLWGSQKRTDGTTLKQNASNYIGSGAVGVSYLIGKKLSLEVKYEDRFFTKSKLKDGNDKGKVHIGVSYFFTR